MEKKKGVIPDYENDIFISYTHVDNDRYAKDRKGWVDSMHEQLETRLFQLLGEKPAITRDVDLRGNKVIRSALILRLQNIAILVAVLSPRYTKSEWCLMELSEFCRKIDRNNPQPFQTDAPIFKVVKTPVSKDRYPEELRELLGYKFYQEDPLGGRPVEFSHEFGFPYFKKFRRRVNDLAWDIKEFIETLQETPSGRLVLPRAQDTVYLAFTGSDADEDRDRIRRELQSCGYRVLPYRDFPIDPVKLKEVIKEDLRMSCLSIHVIGKYYDGAGPSSPSLVQLQHELAVERGRESGFSQVIWIPRSLEVADEDQRRLIDTLRDDAWTHRHIEVFESRLEDLKTDIRIKLRQLEDAIQPAPQADHVPHSKVRSNPNERLELYVINDYEDYEGTAQLRDFLHNQNFVVRRMPNTSEEMQAAAALQLHRENLKDCDGVIVFYGRASDLWMCQKENELRKNRRGRSPALLGEAVYLSEPVTHAKQGFRSNELTIINEQGEFPPKTLLTFLHELRSKKAELEGAVK